MHGEKYVVVLPLHHALAYLDEVKTFHTTTLIDSLNDSAVTTQKTASIFLFLL